MDSAIRSWRWLPFQLASAASLALAYLSRTSGYMGSSYGSANTVLLRLRLSLSRRDRDLLRFCLVSGFAGFLRF